MYAEGIITPGPFSRFGGCPSLGRHDFMTSTFVRRRKRIEKLRYIHRNPVARRLVESPEQWQWSSFRWYSSGEVGPVRINDTDILVMTIRPLAA